MVGVNREAIMGKSAQHRAWISIISLRVASAALALPVVLVLGLVATPSAQAQTLTVLYNFQGSPDGEYPYAGLVRDKAGNLYGTTSNGGASDCSCGVVFKVDVSGTETLLHTFTDSPDGAEPTYGSLIQDANGNLYGTTSNGGSNGGGTVFKVVKSRGVWTERVLYSFGKRAPDGIGPQAGLVRDAAGNLYGTTASGGGAELGTVFKLDTNGKEILLHAFGGTSRRDGALPYGGLIRDSLGNLYGTTMKGGISHSFGTVFKLEANHKEVVLHTFRGISGDGAYPLGNLVMDPEGNLYGTTEQGGNDNCYPPLGCGTVYKVNKSGKETVLYRLKRTYAQGSDSGVIRDGAGNLYGTSGGGAFGYGAVFKLDSVGKETVLHSFAGGTGGGDPSGALIMDDVGNLYGTTIVGGSGGCPAGGCGTVWKLTP